MTKTLVIYYSLEGSTKKIAEWIGKETGVDVAAVHPRRELKAKGFGKYILGGFQVVTKQKPALQPFTLNLDEYDIVLLGAPIWAGTFAPPVNTLLSSYLKNKKVGYFYCYEGGDKNAVAKAKRAVNKENTLISAFACLGVAKNFDLIKEKVADWAKSVIKECENQ